MLLPLAATLIYKMDGDITYRLTNMAAFIIPSIILYTLFWIFRNISLNEAPKTKHIMLTFALTWIIIAIIGSIPFLMRGVLGLLDSVGELKREMYESIRKGKKKDAERYFALMEEIFDALLPLRFSNAVLPDFRRKQDVARIQIEQARGELL